MTPLQIIAVVIHCLLFYLCAALASAIISHGDISISYHLVEIKCFYCFVVFVEAEVL